MSFPYVLVHPTEDTVLETIIRGTPFGEVNTRQNSALNHKPFILPMERVGYEPVDPMVEVRTGPIFDVQTDKCVATFAIRAKTQPELDADQRDADAGTLRGAGKDVALVLIELIDKLLADNVIAATDFTTDVRQVYLNLKVIADRAKA